MRILNFLIAITLTTTLAYAQETEGKEAEKKTFTAEVNDEGVQVVNILGGEYFFDPNHIIVKVNTPVKLIVKRKSIIVHHNILIEAPTAGMEFDVDFSTKGEVVEFTPTQTGKFDIVCNKKLLWFKSHKEKGMVGVIEVVE